MKRLYNNTGLEIFHVYDSTLKMDLPATNWDFGETRWIPDNNEFPEYTEKWKLAYGLQKELIRYGIPDSDNPMAYTELLFYIYGPWFNIAKYYSPIEEDISDDTLFENLIEMITNAKLLPLPEYSPLFGESTNYGLECSVISHQILVNKYPEFYNTRDPDGGISLKNANIILPRTTVKGLIQTTENRKKKAKEIFTKSDANLADFSYSLGSTNQSRPSKSVLDEESISNLFEIIANNQSTSFQKEYVNRFSTDIVMSGPFDKDTGSRSSDNPDFSGNVRNPKDPTTTDTGIFTRLLHLKENVFAKNNLQRLEDTAKSNGFDFMPPKKGVNREYAGTPRYVFSDLFMKFRKSFYTETFRVFVTQSLRMHVNSIHYLLLFHRGAIPPNINVFQTIFRKREDGATLSLMEEKILERMPIWIPVAMMIGKHNPVEKADGYKINTVVLDVIMDEMEARTNPFIFSDILEEITDLNFMYNLPPTFEELQCLFLLLLDSLFDMEYFSLVAKRQDLSEQELIWVSEQETRTRWTINDVKSNIEEIVSIGRLHLVGDGSKFWDIWIRIHRFKHGDKKIREYPKALASTKILYDIYMQNINILSSNFEIDEIETITSTLQEIEYLVLNRYFLWLWNSDTFFPFPKVRLESELQKLQFNRIFDSSSPDDMITVLYEVIAKMITVDPLQRKYLYLYNMNDNQIVDRLILNFFYIPEDGILMDLMAWKNSIGGDIDKDTSFRKSYITNITALTEIQYYELIMKLTFHGSFYKKWIQKPIVPNPQAKYIFAIRDKLKEAEVADIISNRVSHLSQPVCIRWTLSKYGRIFFIISNWPWFRTIEHLEITWTIKASIGGVEVFDSEKIEIGVFNTIYMIENTEKHFPLEIIIPTTAILQMTRHKLGFGSDTDTFTKTKTPVIIYIMCNLKGEVSSEYTVTHDKNRKESIKGEFPIDLIRECKLYVE